MSISSIYNPLSNAFNPGSFAACGLFLVFGISPLSPIFLAIIGPVLVLHVACDRGDAINKLGLEQDVRVVKHAVLEGHHNKLKTEHR